MVAVDNWTKMLQKCNSSNKISHRHKKVEDNEEEEL